MVFLTKKKRNQGGQCSDRDKLAQKFIQNKATAAAVISRLRISNNGEIKEI